MPHFDQELAGLLCACYVVVKKCLEKKLDFCGVESSDYFRKHPLAERTNLGKRI